MFRSYKWLQLLNTSIALQLKIYWTNLDVQIDCGEELDNFGFSGAIGMILLRCLNNQIRQHRQFSDA